MLKSFLAFRRAKEAENEALFLSPGWATPSKPVSLSKPPNEDDYVLWSEVQSFIQMAEQALAVRNVTNEHLRQELAAERTEKSKVQQTSSAAQEESCFLAEHMQGLLDERAALKEELDKARRQADYLSQENELLRQELLEGATLGEESSAALQLLARQQEELRMAKGELRAEKQRTAQLENDNMQLVARVSALERAHTAQATAMLSCLEESERVRLQQLSIAIPDSPLVGGPPRRGGFTDDGGGSGSSSAGTGGAASAAFTDALDLGSDGSFVSCITPASASGGATSAHGCASMFCSPSPSPSKARGRSRQQAAGSAPVAGAATPGDA